MDSRTKELILPPKVVTSACLRLFAVELGKDEKHSQFSPSRWSFLPLSPLSSRLGGTQPVVK